MFLSRKSLLPVSLIQPRLSSLFWGYSILPACVRVFVCVCDGHKACMEQIVCLLYGTLMCWRFCARGINYLKRVSVGNTVKWLKLTK